MTDVIVSPGFHWAFAILADEGDRQTLDRWSHQLVRRHCRRVGIPQPARIGVPYVILESKMSKLKGERL